MLRCIFFSIHINRFNDEMFLDPFVSVAELFGSPCSFLVSHIQNNSFTMAISYRIGKYWSSSPFGLSLYHCDYIHVLFFSPFLPHFHDSLSYEFFIPVHTPLLHITHFLSKRFFFHFRLSKFQFFFLFYLILSSSALSA